MSALAGPVQLPAEATIHLPPGDYLVSTGPASFAIRFARAS
jgi:hypothetical protein